MGQIAERFRNSKGTARNILERPVVVMDTLSAHKTRGGTRLLEDAGAELRFFPPFSPDLNPVELMWSEVKGYLRGAKARTLVDLVGAIADALGTAAPENARAFFHLGAGAVQ